MLAHWRKLAGGVTDRHLAVTLIPPDLSLFLIGGHDFKLSLFIHRDLIHLHQQSEKSDA